MSDAGTWSSLKRIARDEWTHLTTVQASERPWRMPMCAALATGLPVVLGAAFGRLGDGLVASLGGLVFLYLPETPLSHRMVSLMASAFGLTASWTLGLLSHSVPAAMMAVLVFIAILVTMVCRFYAVAPPGSLFFIMAAAIGAYTPLEPAQIPRLVGLVAMGTLLACLVAFFYSLLDLRARAPKPVAPLPPASFDFVVFDSVVIGAFVGISLAVAQLFRLEKAYWVPVSCLAVIQGASLRAVWNRQLQRVLGTGVGLVLAWGLLLLPLGPWSVAALMMALTVVIETLVVRHYAVAAVFITPLTILLAEAATLGAQAPAALIGARFVDTVLGSLVGLAGGICLHSVRLRAAARAALRRLGFVIRQDAP